MPNDVKSLNSSPLWDICSSLSGELSRLIDECRYADVSIDKLLKVSVSIRFNADNPYVLIKTEKNFIEIRFDSLGYYALVFNADYIQEYRPIRFNSISFSADGLLIQTKKETA